jgi:uncharacterized protein (UPF0333 family)
MFEKFLKEEKAQGAIEYILLAGGIIVAAVVIFAIYSSMTKTAGERMANATDAATTEMAEQINTGVTGM